MTSIVTSHHPSVLLEAFSGSRSERSFRFDGLETVIVARTLAEVIPALAEVESAVARGRHAAGFVGYEAAAALNPDLAVKESAEMPLVWFGIFIDRQCYRPDREGQDSGNCSITAPELEIDPESYASSVAAIRVAIAAGETYQVNFTTRQRFMVCGDPFTLYRRMCLNQQAPFCAWIDTGEHRILSASPELFFSLQNDTITMKPMKGTASRMPAAGDDRHQRELLAQDPKERAENLMIVDLVRNDLSTIAETGSVKVSALFEVETFPTVHQMTSTVTARIRPEVGLTDIFRALFPCGSVTGAPKRRTMEIIRSLETASRGVYCGAIGYVSPGREAVFSVAIRTAVVHAATGSADIGIGSGITWDSDAGSEFSECLAKSAFISRDSNPFQLIETVRHDRDGYLLLDRHLQRLSESAVYFNFAFGEEELRKRLAELEQRLSGVHKVRILLDRSGAVSLESSPVIDPEPAAPPAPVVLSRQRVDPSDPFLFHKTTRRGVYDSELKSHPGAYDVVFLNQRDELTEGSFNTLIVSLNGQLLTPPLECGLLPGVLRAELLDAGAIREAVLHRDDLYRAERIWLVNSVRGWRECTMTN